MKYIKSYSGINEASGHWVEDLMPILKFHREEEILDLFYDISEWYGSPQIQKCVTDDGFRSPGPKSELMHKSFYESYVVQLFGNNSVQTHNRMGENTKLVDFYQEMLTLLRRLQSYGYLYDVGGGSYRHISIRILHPDDKIDARDVIKDMKKASLKAKYGVDGPGLEYAHELLSKHDKIMILSSGPGKSIIISQKDPNYDLNRIKDIVGKILGDNFNIRPFNDSRELIITEL